MNFWKQDFALLEAPVMETDKLDASTPEGSEVCARLSRATISHWAKSPSGLVTHRQPSTRGLWRQPWTISWSKLMLVPSGSDRKTFFPPSVTGPHSDCRRGPFLVLGDHYISVLIWGVLNYPVHPKWTVWTRTRRNCAVREESRQCCHHIK